MTTEELEAKLEKYSDFHLAYSSTAVFRTMECRICGRPVRETSLGRASHYKAHVRDLAKRRSSAAPKTAVLPASPPAQEPVTAVIGAPLPEYFDAKDAGQDWHLRCKKCRAGWALKKSSTAPGNLLHLLNHAAGHKAAKTE